MSVHDMTEIEKKLAKQFGAQKFYLRQNSPLLPDSKKIEKVLLPKR